MFLFTTIGPQLPQQVDLLTKSLADSTAKQDTVRVETRTDVRPVQVRPAPAANPVGQFLSSLNPALINLAERHIMPLLQTALANINLLNSQQRTTVERTITTALQLPSSSAFLGQIAAYGIQAFMNTELKPELAAFLRSRRNPSNNSNSPNNPNISRSSSRIA